ncbi:MAG: hypothetical protein Q8N31_10645 [Reyranella sp.]|nr:hypothetical protein [Reyranella sp.]MDP3160465.1 hypothetical protein [Reyranella sp.]
MTQHSVRKPESRQTRGGYRSRPVYLLAGLGTWRLDLSIYRVHSDKVVQASSADIQLSDEEREILETTIG